ncbi:MAG: glutamate--tRNA ligase [Gammaproteobacteria bacterium]|nr:glutamate--tRNA ligase [Gammaproteobacteria bacterium]
MKVRTRFAPSPTGYLHVGGARTALFCWLFARRHGGTFILRIEDTDRERSTQESVDAILDGMAWLGLDYDEGPFYQTQRFDRYREYVQRLLDEDKAYYCYCTPAELDAMRADQRERGIKPRYDGRCRARSGPPPAGVDPVVRFKNPVDGNVVIDDLIKGRIVISNGELDDLVIARPDGTPTYNFTVVIDDLEMAITHVIRGDDHVNNTPRQINIFEALGATPPAYAHVPMILGADGQRLSKRHGAVGVMQFRDDGYLPDALINYLVRLGWSHGDQEIFSREELCELFDLTEVNRAASVFDFDKLNWLNAHYIKNADTKMLAALLREQLDKCGVDVDEGPDLEVLVDVQRDRAKTLAEMAEKSLFAFGDLDGYVEKAARKHLKPAAAAGLAAVRERLAQVDPWQMEPIHAAVVATAESEDIKLGKLAQPLRVAVTGSDMSPSIDATLLLVGQARSLERINAALEYIAASAAAP